MPSDSDSKLRPPFLAWLFLFFSLGFGFIWWARHTAPSTTPVNAAKNKLVKVSWRKSIGAGPIRSSSKLNLDPDKNVYPDEPAPTEIYHDLLKNFGENMDQMRSAYSEDLVKRAIEYCRTRQEWKTREDTFISIASQWGKMDDATRTEKLSDITEILNFGTAAVRDALAELKPDSTDSKAIPKAK
jgi:hypothetical protein